MEQSGTTQTTATGFTVRCEREGLLMALQAAHAVVPTNSPKPILTNMQLRAYGDGLEVNATDQQVGLRVVLRRLQVLASGSVVIPVRQLVGILKESASPDVLLEVGAQHGPDQVAIRLIDGEYVIPQVVGETFPAISQFPQIGECITVPGPELEIMIRKTLFAVDKDRTSAVLGGVYFEVGEGELIMAGTDGKILCEATRRGEEFNIPIKVIIPAGTINHLARILASGVPGEVEIAIESKLVFLRVVVAASDAPNAPAVQVELTSRLVEGSYPAYRNALPKEPQYRVEFATADLRSAVRRTALMTSNSSRGIVAALEAGQCMLRNMIATGGRAEIPVTCAYDGPPTKVGLNAGYLQSILRVYEEDTVSLELNGLGRGMIMREHGMTYLIMPISLST
ncbi:MAG: DNA polymerase III subunit beta [Planctomycetota bacterium]